jgi:phosphate transport system permease protein
VQQLLIAVKLMQRPTIAFLWVCITPVSEQQLNLFLNEIRNLVNNSISASDVSPEIAAAADHYGELQNISNTALFVVAIALGLGGATYRLVAHS